ncbi:unnamed protein product [Triticum turgidum subsp. durum]|uniref:Uncharacterized protein n=1 Tax=Triticum turgidum subsp. durum TaxID=4567 RepID=A0A9R1NWM2_TRITD|nr:unnamed protein product [Triticum turgidum subsp. durum]
MDRGQQQGVSLQPHRFDHPRMQYPQHGGGRSRVPPFARGGRGQKHFYRQPPPPPPSIQPGAPARHRYEVLMEAGRLAAEYLVAKGVLPPASLQRGGGAGWGQMPPAPPLPQAQEAPAFYDSRRNGRQRLDDEYGNPNPRSRRNHGGDYNGGDNGNYNGRGKRKFGAYNRNSEWGRDRERSRDYLDSRNYGDDDEEDRAPGYRRDRRASAGIDEVGSSVSGVAGDRPTSKLEAVGESELEDTGSKVSSNSNVRKDVDVVQEVQNENEANKMEEDAKVSDSEVVEKGINSESIHTNASSGVVEEGEINHSPVPSDDKPDDGSIMDEKAEHDKSLDDKAEYEKGSSVENNLHGGCQNLLSNCNFARAPTRPRSIPAHRNGASTHRDTALAKQVDLAPPMVIDESANDSSLTNVQGDNKDHLVCLEHTDPSLACNQMVEHVGLQEAAAQTEIRDVQEQNSTAQHYTVQEIKECDGLNPTLASQHDCSKLQVREEVQIYNIDTPPQHEDLIDSADKGKTTDSVELLPNIKDEAVVTIKQEELGQSSSFKICDLNLIGSPELADIRNDPGFGQCSNVVCSMEVQNQQPFDFGTTVGNNASNTDRFSQIPLNDKVIQIIDIEDDPPIEPSVSDTLRPKSEMVYPSMDNMMSSSVNTNIFPGTQDGYNIAIPDFLGADMPCYPPLHADLHAEMGLNDPEVITVMDDPIYDSLGDIGFMEVWDQQPPDYKFF